MKKETKNISKHVRISERENDNLKQICKKLDMKESHLMRLLLTDLNYRYCQDLRDKQAHRNYEEIENIAIRKERIRLLKNATTNFNQVSKALNESRYSYYASNIKSVLNSLNLVINDFKLANEKEIKMPVLDKLESSEKKEINSVASQKKDVRHVQDIPQKVQKEPVQAPKKVEKETYPRTEKEWAEYRERMNKKYKEDARIAQEKTNAMIKEFNESRMRDLS